MAINLTYKGLTGLRRTLTGFDETTTVDNLIATIAADEELDTNYYVISKEGDPTNTLSTSYSDSSATVASIGIVTGDIIICKPNTIGTTKQTRQVMKLDIAQKKREGGPDDDTTAVFYRSNNSYDLTSLPDTYNDNLPGADDNPNTGGLIQKRPWVSVGAIAAPASIQESVGGGSIPDLQIWYDGADTNTYIPNATDEGQITQWTDKSSFAHNANPNGGSAKPTYEDTTLQNGYGYLEFDGNDELSVNPFTALDGATAWSMFVVANVTDLTTHSGLTGTENGDFRIRIDSNGATSLRADPTAFVYSPSGTITEDTWHIWSLIYDGSQTGTARLVGRLDKTALTTYTGTPAASVTSGSGTMFIGRDGLDANYYHDGYIAEVIMFNRALSATEYANVENYLSNKWGL